MSTKLEQAIGQIIADVLEQTSSFRPETMEYKAIDRMANLISVRPDVDRVNSKFGKEVADDYEKAIRDLNDNFPEDNSDTYAHFTMDESRTAKVPGTIKSMQNLIININSAASYDPDLWAAADALRQRMRADKAKSVAVSGSVHIDIQNVRVVCKKYKRPRLVYDTKTVVKGMEITKTRPVPRAMQQTIRAHDNIARAMTVCKLKFLRHARKTFKDLNITPDDVDPQHWETCSSEISDLVSKFERILQRNYDSANKLSQQQLSSKLHRLARAHLRNCLLAKYEEKVSPNARTSLTRT
jgi:hypothetical protein